MLQGSRGLGLKQYYKQLASSISKLVHQSSRGDAEHISQGIRKQTGTG